MPAAAASTASPATGIVEDVELGLPRVCHGKPRSNGRVDRIGIESRSDGFSRVDQI